MQALLALVVDYANGLTQMELAQKHDMHVQTVRKRLKEVGVNLRARVKLLSSAQLEAALSSIACGASLRATARQLGVSHATLTRNLKPGKVRTFTIAYHQWKRFKPCLLYTSRCV